MKIPASLLPLWFAASILFFSVLGCTHHSSEPNPEVVRLEKKAEAIEHELAGFEDKIKAANTDHGLKHRLMEDRELTKSRLERVKERLALEKKK